MTTRWNLPTDTITRAIEPLRPDCEDPLAAFACAAWSFIVEPGDRVAGALIGALGETAALDLVVSRVSPVDIARASGRAVTESEVNEAMHRWESRMDTAAIFRSLTIASSQSVRLVIPSDGEWPDGVADLGAHGPRALWVRGDVLKVPRLEHSVALVGARASTGYGEHVAMDFAAGVAQRGLTVVSGGAYGIDGMAHRAALAVEGDTVAVLAGGVDQLYPAGHDELLRSIIRTGAVVSEVPCGGAPTRWRFLQRNRIIAALAAVTVVVEAGHRSGSLNTASHARDLGRPVGVVPGQITSASSAGCHRLLRDNAAASVVTGVPEIIELMTGETSAVVFDRRDSGEVIRVLDSLSRRSFRTLDDIAVRTGLAMSDITAALGLLELEGRVEGGGSGWRKT